MNIGNGKLIADGSGKKEAISLVRLSKGHDPPRQCAP